MAGAAVCIILMYISQFIQLTSKKFFITRARAFVTQLVDNEPVTVNQLYYFLYRNSTPGATDATASGNQLIVLNADELCGGTRAFANFSDVAAA